MGDIADEDNHKGDVVILNHLHSPRPIHIMCHLSEPLPHGFHIGAAEENTCKGDKDKGEGDLPKAGYPSGGMLVGADLAPILIGNDP